MTRKSLADSLQIAADGSLVAHTAAGNVIQAAPTLYQMGSGGRELVSGSFVLNTDGSVSFRGGNYDPSRELVIDPAMLYSTYLGGAGADEARAVAVDPLGNSYITGDTNSLNFPNNAFGLLPAGGGTDVFVTKFDPNGGLVWSTVFGGTNLDVSYGIAVDPATQRAYIVGLTMSGNFPTTPGAFQAALGGGMHAFVTELDVNGNFLIYSTYLGGANSEAGTAIALQNGHAYVTGWTLSPNFPTAGVPGQAAIGGGMDAFDAELDPTATGAASLVYSTFLGGAGDDQGLGIAVLNGNAYVTGWTESAKLPTTRGAYQEDQPPLPPGAMGPGRDAFFAEIDPNGTFLYVTYLGGPNADEGHAIAVDAAGNAYITGLAGDGFPITPITAVQPAYGGGFSDVFLTEINPGGKGAGDLMYSTYLGGAMADEGNGITLGVVRGTPLAIITGDTNSPAPVPPPAPPGFPVAGVWPAWGMALNGGFDAFVAGIDPTVPGWLAFSGYLGGNQVDWGKGIAFFNDPAGSSTVTVAGWTGSPNFPVGASFQLAFGGGADDAFVTKLVL